MFGSNLFLYSQEGEKQNIAYKKKKKKNSLRSQWSSCVLCNLVTRALVVLRQQVAEPNRHLHIIGPLTRLRFFFKYLDRNESDEYEVGIWEKEHSRKKKKISGSDAAE